MAENLRLFARLEKLADPDAAVDEMLDQTGLRDRADEEVGQLSGGNQQRVNIAIGLLCEPSVLLLDEPSASLDPRQRERLWEFIGGARRPRHDGRVLDPQRRRGRALRHRVLVLVDGELLFTGTPTELERGSAATRATSRRHSSASCTSGATEMRWLLVKDLQILKRSPLLVGLLSSTRSRSR